MVSDSILAAKNQPNPLFFIYPFPFFLFSFTRFPFRLSFSIFSTFFPSFNLLFFLFSRFPNFPAYFSPYSLSAHPLNALFFNHSIIPPNSLTSGAHKRNPSGCAKNPEYLR
jgi:hypothetical protein